VKPIRAASLIRTSVWEIPRISPVRPTSPKTTVPAAVGRSRKLETIAEYVENKGILARVKAMGVDYGQGYAIARPERLGKALDGLRPGKVAQAV